jgi:hypothetical protein
MLLIGYCLLNKLFGMVDDIKIIKTEQLSIGKAELRADGILTFEPDPALIKDYTMPILEEMLDALLRITDGTPRPFYVDNRYVLAMLGQKERDYLEDNLERFATAAAMTESSPITRMIGNTFFRFKKPHMDFKIFKEKGPAIEWLLSLE